MLTCCICFHSPKDYERLLAKWTKVYKHWTMTPLDQRYLSIWLYFWISFSYISSVFELLAFCFKNSSAIFLGGAGGGGAKTSLLITQKWRICLSICIGFKCTLNIAFKKSYISFITSVYLFEIREFCRFVLPLCVSWRWCWHRQCCLWCYFKYVSQWKETRFFYLYF